MVFSVLPFHQALSFQALSSFACLGNMFSLAIMNAKLAALPLILVLASVHHSLWPAQAQSASFSYPNDSSSNILLLGDAVERNQVIELTKNTDSEALDDSAGRMLCRTPVRMFDPRTNKTASFSTSFSFRIYSVNSSYQGDGLAFLIAPDNVTVGDHGEQLGAFTASSKVAVNKHTFAVEFDTWKNTDIHDPNGNHVGLDATNISSFTYSNASAVGVQLNDGSIITAWIDFDGARSILQVRISSDTVEPVEPLIDAKVNFAEIFNEFMYVGFSASTGFSNEAHTLISWTFSSWGLEGSSGEASDETPHDQLPGKSGAGTAFAFCLIGAFAVLAFGLFAWKLIAKRGESYFRRAKDYDSCGIPRVFTYKELYAATQGFSDKRRLGKGGTGNYFKGVLVDSGAVVAVKQIAKYPQEGLQEFVEEVNMLSGLRHRNLVQIQGWCLEKEELMVVYEFMPNDSLDNFLFDGHYEVLSWAQRYGIACGVAEGLMYLHQGVGRSKEVLLHRNVKTSNIMLDNNFNAKLGDYGVGKVIKRGILEATFGYVAPEEVEKGIENQKTDVFSYGTMLLELATGKRALEKGVVLVDKIWELQEEGLILEAADNKLEKCFDITEMELLLNLGLLCSVPEPSLRPSMDLIDAILHGRSSLPPLPLNPRPCRPFSLDAHSSLQISIHQLLSS